MWSRHSRRIEPMSLSTYAFFQGDRNAIGRSRMPMARRRCTKISPYEVSRSRMRYRGAWSHGKASVIWREIHSAAGLSVTLNDTKSRRSCRMSYMPYADKAIENPERNRWKDKQVDRCDAVGMIAQKRPPALRRWQPAAAHIPSNRRLSDLEVELEQFTVNARCAPERVRPAHFANERAQLSRDLRSANTVARPPAPIRPKSSSVPANDSF